MRDYSLQGKDPRSLAGLLGESGDIWGEEDLAAILRHQLQAPLGFDLRHLGPDTHNTVTRLTRSAHVPLKTFADLFASPDPPIDLLQLAKEFGKTADGRSHAMLPRDIGKVLYYAAIMTARLRCDARISDLSVSDLLTGVQWVLRRPWLDESMRRLFEESLTMLLPKTQ